MSDLEVNNLISHDFDSSIRIIEVPKGYVIYLSCSKCRNKYSVFTYDYLSKRDVIPYITSRIENKTIKMFSLIELDDDCNTLKFKSLLG